MVWSEGCVFHLFSSSSLVWMLWVNFYFDYVQAFNRNFGVLNLLYFHVHSIVLVVVHLGETSMYIVISSSTSSHREGNRLENARS